MSLLPLAALLIVTAAGVYAAGRLWAAAGRHDAARRRWRP